MATYPIRRVRSGIEETLAWVSMWYRTQARNLDVLHISCAKTIRDRITGQLYLERHDQAIASFGGADRIVLAANRLEFHLNPKGVKALELEASFALVIPDQLSGWKKAIGVFKEMATYPTGRVIEIL